MAEERKKSPFSGHPVPEGRPPWKAGEEAREIGRRGGLKSAEVRKARKTLREELLQLLSEDITDKRGNTMKAQTAVSTALMKSALSGNVKAFETIRDTIGEKPADNLNVAVADMQALDEAFDGMKKNDE